MENKKYTLYVNVIGKSGDEIIEEIAQAHAWFRNPRKKKTFYGPFRASKCSWLLEKDDFDYLKELIIFRCKHIHDDKVHLLVEDFNNLFIIERVEF